jgi:LysM repeat protein
MITVQPGDTLWSIATRVAPNADPRVTVQRIVDLNGMSGTAIASGEQLKLPS